MLADFYVPEYWDNLYHTGSFWADTSSPLRTDDVVEVTRKSSKRCLESEVDEEMEVDEERLSKQPRVDIRDK